MKSDGKRLPANSLTVCKIEGCERKASAFHLCSTHYSKFRKYGDPLAGKTNYHGLLCKVEGCDAKTKGLGFCPKHYERFKKHGDEFKISHYCFNVEKLAELALKNANEPIIFESKICKVEGCDREIKAHGFCEFHDRRNEKYGDPLAGKPKFLLPGEQDICKFEGCEIKAKSLHYCYKHFSKLKKYGDPSGGDVKDGRTKVWQVGHLGYIVRYDPTSPYKSSKSTVFQHREIMGELIGRPLLKNENVHHKNGNKADNRIENLELWSSQQPCGQRIKDKAIYALEILTQYGFIIDGKLDLEKIDELK